jgi:hypothetical protein
MGEMIMTYNMFNGYMNQGDHFEDKEMGGYN